MIPKKIYLNYVCEDDAQKTWSENPIGVGDCEMQNREYTDLTQVWHAPTDVPDCKRRLLCYTGNCFFDFVLDIDNDDILTWDGHVRAAGIRCWAYADELLPNPMLL